GYDAESDSSLRNRIVSATQSIGKATDNALEYYIGNVSGVRNVIIESPLQTTVNGETKTVDEETSFYVDNTPVANIISVSGSSGYSYTVSDVNEESGEVTLDKKTEVNETFTIDYTYYTPGKLKIHVEGGNVGDADTEDTIVYAIENTRAAGVQCVGYGTGDTNAEGSDSSPFSWFYRPNNVQIDIEMTVYFDDESTMSEATKDLIIDEIETAVTDYINGLPMNEKIYKNKILQIAIGNDTSIVDAQLDSWSKDSVNQSTDLVYIQGGDTDIHVMQNLTVNKASEV
ncbi:MAG: hypothetical protein MJB12_04685, partial [Firmicutes bacterium]|nr:hypothetical protein [Bacillota bacterium]